MDDEHEDAEYGDLRPHADEEQAAWELAAKRAAATGRPVTVVRFVGTGSGQVYDLEGDEAVARGSVPLD